MRRLLLILALLVLPAVVVASTYTDAPARAQRALKTTPAPENGKKPACSKPKKGQKKSKAKCTTKKKKTPTPRPAPTKVPTSTPTPTATDTPTATPTSTSTATPTPTPTSSTGSIAVTALAERGYQSAFYICGLPAGVTASFSPNPAVSTVDRSSVLGSASHATLTLSAQYTAVPNTYWLALHAVYQTSTGAFVSSPPGGGAIEPSAVLLTVLPGGGARVTATNQVPAVGYQGCSALPPGAIAPPTATPAPVDVKVSATVSNAAPVANESVTVTGNILSRGVPQFNVPMHANWFTPYGIKSCDAITGFDGKASCSVANTSPLHGYVVLVQVTFTFAGGQYNAFTSYVM